MNLIEVKSSVLTCRNCSLVDNCSSPVPGTLVPGSNVMVVGEAPGASEDKQHKPFVGPAGQLLRSWLGRLDLGEVSYANVVSCFPHRTPRKSEVDLCRGNLWNQIAAVGPKYLLVLGATAVSSWWPEIGINDIRGLFWQAYWDNNNSVYDGRGPGDGWSWAFATLHPAAVLRNVGLAEQVNRELRLFAEVVAGKVSPAMVYKDECVLCPSPVEIVNWGVGFCWEHSPRKKPSRIPNYTRKDGFVVPCYDPGLMYNGKMVKTVNVQGKLL